MNLAKYVTPQGPPLVCSRLCVRGAWASADQAPGRCSRVALHSCYFCFCGSLHPIAIPRRRSMGIRASEPYLEEALAVSRSQCSGVWYLVDGCECYEGSRCT